MPRCEYVVIKRDRQWWVTVEGSKRGPYVSQSVAVDAAILSAKLNFREGRAPRVSIEEPEGGMPVLYETEELL